MWPVLPQFQHFGLLLDLDLSLPFLDLDLPRPRLVFFSLLLSLFSRFRAKLNDVPSPESILRTSSAKIRSLTSLNYNFHLPTELLTAVLIGSQLVGRKAKRIRARTSSSKLISTDVN
ncbi:hypothetical protein TorRG33x02_057030 [Trema orientale]|uniref:Uncharacterized protein n=1 Tax=Trema orientale TaxID=63057 RepID=A0A2P5FL11_TREOI|nr:hypothetical protein TorRG33x02_057030 [Trema orientale]